MATAEKVTPSGHATYATDYFKSDADQKVWLDSPHVDNLVTVAIALGGEVWTTRQRQAIAERLADKGMPATTANIEAYVPNKDEEAAWRRQREEMVLRVFGVLARATGSAAKAG